MKKIKLIIVRHGETEENLRREIQGQRHGTLSKLGIKQAQKVAERLRNEKIDLILSSDLNRSADTTREIIKQHPDTPVKYIKELRERSAGIYEGAPRDEYVKIAEKYEGKKEDFRPRGGESHNDLITRVKDFVDSLLKKYPDKTILLSTHGRWMKILMHIYFGRELSGYNVKNTAVYKIELKEDQNHQIHIENCTKHLESE